ncbi:MAG TPA: DUF5946 family protein [Terracidiphilus sp.]|jgi:hypothetical protein|nr:DUF5946 family protein [Terracidiphilus sp.]
MRTCPECGASYEAADANCARRFEALLALDHSRNEPWGSRHGLAFSAYAIQHSDRFPPDVLERAWILLYKVYVNGEDYRRVTDALRRSGRRNPDWELPPVPQSRPRPHFAVTIADLGSFPSETYPQQLEDWCKASLQAWRELPADR